MADRDSEHIMNIVLSLVLTLVTCGLYNLYWQHRQMLAVNDLLGETKYQFWPWLLFTLVTLGLYHVYHEYRMSEDIARLTRPEQKHDGLIAILLTVFGLPFVADAIQQSYINAYFGDDRL